MKQQFNRLQRRKRCSGFTLAEVMIASSLSMTVLIGIMGVYLYVFRFWHGIEQRIAADTDLNMAMSRMIYGMEALGGLRTAQGVRLDKSSDGWTLWYKPGVSSSSSNSLIFSKSQKNLLLNPGNNIVGRDISAAEITVNTRSLEIMLEAEREKAGLHVKRNIETEIFWRN